jgi:predicted metal-dependent hydrolase
MYSSENDKATRSWAIRKKIAWLEDQLAEIEDEPDEPSGVITFTKSFGKHYQVYSYAAIRIDALGKWCVTGPRNPQYVTWDELYAFIQRDEDGHNQIFEAETWSPAL